MNSEEQILRERIILRRAGEAALWIQQAAEKERDRIPLVGFYGEEVPTALIRSCGARCVPLESLVRENSPCVFPPGTFQMMNIHLASILQALEQASEKGMFSLDLVVIPQTDNQLTRMAERLSTLGYPVFQLTAPTDQKDDLALCQYRRSLYKLVRTIEALTGKSPDPKALNGELLERNALSVMLKQLFLLQIEKRSSLHYADLLQLSALSRLTGPGKMTGFVRALLQSAEASPPMDFRGFPLPAKILLAGRVIPQADLPVIRMIESCGAVIAGEFLDEGILRDVNPLPDWKDPVLRAAEDWIRRRPSGMGFFGHEERLSLLREEMRTHGVEGLIWIQLAFDECYDLEFDWLAGRLREDGFPALKLEIGIGGNREALQTRVESFLQVLGQRAAVF